MNIIYLDYQTKSITGGHKYNDAFLEYLKNIVGDNIVKTQKNLLKSIDNLTNQVADLTTQNRMIRERIAELAQTLPSRD